MGEVPIEFNFFVNFERILCCRTNPWVKYPQNSIFFFNFERILYWYEIKAYFLKKFKLFLKYYNALKWEGSLKSWTLQQISLISKYVSNKICTELNLLQKTQWTHISICSWSGARGLQRFCPISAHIIFQKLKSLEHLPQQMLWIRSCTHTFRKTAEKLK